MQTLGQVCCVLLLMLGTLLAGAVRDLWVNSVSISFRQKGMGQRGWVLLDFLNGVKYLAPSDLKLVACRESPKLGSSVPSSPDACQAF